MEITESCGNVFEDMGLNDADILLELAKKATGLKDFKSLVTKHRLDRSIAKSIEKNKNTLIVMSKK